MMPKIFKYEIDFGDNELKIPCTKFKICKVGIQNKKMYVWLLLEDSEATIWRYIKYRIYGTGYFITPEHYKNYHFVDTFFDESYVWHLFMEEIE